jgi:hypothetical protein
MIFVQDMVHIVDTKTTKHFVTSQKHVTFSLLRCLLGTLCKFDVASWFTNNVLLLYPQMGSKVGH